MRAFRLVVLAAAFSLGTVALTAQDAAACKPMPPENTRITQSTEIVVGRVLEVKPVETTAHEGEDVTLYALSVHVESTLRGQTAESELVTVYMVAHADAELDAAHEDETRACAPGEAGLWGAMPELPAQSERFIFFAKPFDGSSTELVLASNQADHVSAASEAAVTTAKQQISYFLTYGYVY